MKILRNNQIENVEVVLGPRGSEESSVLQQYDKKPVPKQDDFLAAIILNLIAHDGRSNWFEGVMLTAVYVIIAMGFYFIG